jgi:hypothetical protein
LLASNEPARYEWAVARSQFFYVRITILTALLLGVLTYAWLDYQRRHARTLWEHPLTVGVVVLDFGQGGGGVDDRALSLLATRASDLGRRLSDEFTRYRDADREMVRVLPFGPVYVKRRPPQPKGEGVLAALRHSYELWRYTSQVDEAAAVPSRGLDSRIYVVAEPVSDEDRKQVEGFSQQGGRIGIARVQLDESTIDLGLFVVAHELMHTLGATDRYDARGQTQIPDGLGNPAQHPLYPQATAEVMARNRVLEPGTEVPPETLDELSVGPLTAAEIGWIP